MNAYSTPCKTHSEVQPLGMFCCYVLVFQKAGTIDFWLVLRVRVSLQPAPAPSYDLPRIVCLSRI